MKTATTLVEGRRTEFRTGVRFPSSPRKRLGTLKNQHSQPFLFVMRVKLCCVSPHRRAMSIRSWSRRTMSVRSWSGRTMSFASAAALAVSVESVSFGPRSRRTVSFFSAAELAAPFRSRPRRAMTFASAAVLAVTVKSVPFRSRSRRAVPRREQVQVGSDDALQVVFQVVLFFRIKAVKKFCRSVLHLIHLLCCLLSFFGQRDHHHSPVTLRRMPFYVSAVFELAQHFPQSLLTDAQQIYKFFLGNFGSHSEQRHDASLPPLRVCKCTRAVLANVLIHHVPRLHKKADQLTIIFDHNYSLDFLSNQIRFPTSRLYVRYLTK